MTPAVRLCQFRETVILMILKIWFQYHGSHILKRLRISNISEGVTGIGDYALSWCENVTSIVLPSTVARIGVDAFGWCSNLKSITLSDNLKTIDSEAFAWCKSLETIEIPANVNDIDSKAFLWCYH